MAIIKCPECTQNVSDSAKSCPHCGFGVRDYIREQMLTAKMETEAQQEAYQFVKKAKADQRLKEELEAQKQAEFEAARIRSLQAQENRKEYWKQNKKRVIISVVSLLLVVAVAFAVWVPFRIKQNAEIHKRLCKEIVGKTFTTQIISGGEPDDNYKIVATRTYFFRDSTTADYSGTVEIVYGDWPNSPGSYSINAYHIEVPLIGSPKLFLQHEERTPIFNIVMDSQGKIVELTSDKWYDYALAD